MFGKDLRVKVLAATVFVSIGAIHATAAFGDGTATGVVVARGDSDASITLRDEDGNKMTYSAKWTHTGPDAAAVDAIGKTLIQSTVKVAWKAARGGRILTQLTLLAPPASKPTSSEGTFVGLVTAKGERFIILKGGDGDPLKFIVHLIGGNRDARPDPDMIKSIASRNVNDRVYVKWDLDKNDSQALVELRAARSTEKTTYPIRDAKKATSAPAGTEGSIIVGKVDDITGIGVDIKTADGKVEHYLPRMIPEDGDKPAHLDADIVRTITYLHIHDTVQVTWVPQDKNKRITAIKTVPAGTTQPVDDSGKPLAADTTSGNETVVKVADDFKEGDEGTFAGTVLENDSGSVTIRTDEDTPRKLKFSPKWVGGSSDQGGGLDQAMQKTMDKLKPGQKVQIKWVFQERLRAATITAGGGGGSDKPAAAEPKAGDSGAYTGTLVQKDDASITVKIDGDVPRNLKFIPKGDDKNILATFRGIDVGTKVEVQWSMDEHLRVTKLTKARAD